MMNSVASFKYYFSLDYLWSTVSGSRFDIFYLVLSLLVLIFVIGYRLFLFFRGGRAAAYRSFDQLWFWGSIVLSAIGLFIYFSRAEAIPIFSTRLVSYTWILCLVVFAIYVACNYRKTMPEKLHTYYNQKRKARYLRR